MAERFALTRWQPLRELAAWEREIDELLGRSFRLLPLDLWHRPKFVEFEHLAPLEVFERDGQTVVRLEVPGVEMEDIDISITDGALTIKGEKKLEEETKKEGYYHSERYYGSFHRTIPIPEGIDESKISASCDSGVLEVILPKAEETKSHKVKVKAKK